MTKHRRRLELRILDLPGLTPEPAAMRAGIVAWTDDDAPRTATELAAAGVLVTGNWGRIRAAGHLYNSEADIARLLEVLEARR